MGLWEGENGVFFPKGVKSVLCKRQLNGFFGSYFEPVQRSLCRGRLTCFGKVNECFTPRGQRATLLEAGELLEKEVQH